MALEGYQWLSRAVAVIPKSGSRAIGRAVCVPPRYLWQHFDEVEGIDFTAVPANECCSNRLKTLGSGMSEDGI